MSKNTSLIEGSVTKSLVSFTVPVFFALLLQIMYGSVDMIVVGNFATVADVSGVTIGSQIMQTLTSLCTGLAMGTTILLGQKIGEKNEKDTGFVVSNSILIFLILAFAIMAFLLIFKSNVISWMNTPENSISQTSDYLFYCTLGIPMIFSYNVLGSIFRGIGDSKTPLLAVAIACAFNIAGDLAFVWGLNMGAGGAALATVIAQTVSVVVSIYVIAKRGNLPFKFDKNIMKIKGNLIKKVFELGSPIALQSILVSLSFLFITVIINQFGVVYSAAIGLSEKIIDSIMLVPIAFMQSISVFVAQNYGARMFKRAKKGMFVAIVISLTFGVFMFYLGSFHGEILARIFSDDSQVIAATKDYLKSYAIDCMLVSIMFCMNGYFNGCGKTVFVMIQGVAGALAIRVPLAFLFSKIEPFSLFNIGFATPLSTLMQIVLCVVYFIIIEKTMNKTIERQPAKVATKI